MTRKLFAVLMTFVMLTAFCFTSASADGYAFVLEAKSDSYELSKGDSFSVTFFANGISEPSGLLAINAAVKYDPSHIKFISCEQIVPSKWDGSFIEHPAPTNGSIDIVLCFDGKKLDETTGTTENNTLGFKLNFTVETSSATYTTISVPEGIELSGTTGLPNLESCAGLGVSCTLSLNQSTSDSSEGDISSPSDPGDDTSTDISNGISEDSSSENNGSSEGTNSDGDTENSASGEIGENSTDESSPEDTSVDSSSEDEDDEDKKKGNGSNSPDDDEGGWIKILIWIGIACALVAVVAVVVYILKTKKNDMNPVNPS